MKAPEKLYYAPYGDIRENHPITDDDIEYTRTDAFIEKACEWLRKNADNYTWYDETEHESGMTDEFIDVFKNYMKGE